MKNREMELKKKDGKISRFKRIMEYVPLYMKLVVFGVRKEKIETRL